jgi:hypothetical protein
VNNMGFHSISAHGKDMMEWLGQDMIEYLNLIYPDGNPVLYAADLSVRNVRRVNEAAGSKVGVYQTPYATTSRTRAYANLTDDYRFPVYPFNIKGTDGVNIERDYLSNPVECMIKGDSYYVEFLYENNSLLDDMGEQPVTFFLSADATIAPTDPGNPSLPVNQTDFVNSLAPSITPIDLPIGPIDPTTNLVDPEIKISFIRDPLYSNLDPAADFFECYDIGICTVAVRRSHMKTDDTSGTGNHGLGITHRSRIMIPPASIDPISGTPNTDDIPEGHYFIGVVVGPILQLDSSGNPVYDANGNLVKIADDNPRNNVTYMEVELVNPSTGCY